jgi:hypothetical protein
LIPVNTFARRSDRVRISGVARSKRAIPTRDEGRIRSADRAAGTHQFAATLKTSDKINGFLAKVENVMKNRASSSPKRGA